MKTRDPWCAIALVGCIALLAGFVTLILGCDGSVGTIKIGLIGPLSGPNAKYGIWMKNGVDLAVERARAKGGISGRSIEILYEDDETKPQRAALAMRKLVETDRVIAVLGSWASSCVLAQAPIAEESRTILMAQGISPQIRYAGDYVFRDIPDASLSLSVLVPFALSRGVHKAATIFVNNDYGRDQARVFREKLTALGGQVVFEEGYDPDATDFRTILAKLKGKEFDAAYLPGYSEVGLILRQMREIELTCQVYSSDPFENEDVLVAAAGAAEGVIYPSYFTADGAEGAMSVFVHAYREKYGVDPEGTAALAYNGMEILLHVITRAGTDASAIRDSLYSLKNYPSTLGSVTYDEYGDIQLPIMMKTVKNGKFVRLF